MALATVDAAMLMIGVEREKGKERKGLGVLLSSHILRCDAAKKIKRWRCVEGGCCVEDVWRVKPRCEFECLGSICLVTKAG